MLGMLSRQDEDNHHSSLLARTLHLQSNLYWLKGRQRQQNGGISIQGHSSTCHHIVVGIEFLDLFIR
jgi:hypothetical protein